MYIALFKVHTATGSKSELCVLLKATWTRVGIEPPTPWLKDILADHWPSGAPVPLFIQIHSVPGAARQERPENMNIFHLLLCLWIRQAAHMTCVWVAGVGRGEIVHRYSWSSPPPPPSSSSSSSSSALQRFSIVLFEKTSRRGTIPSEERLLHAHWHVHYMTLFTQGDVTLQKLFERRHKSFGSRFGFHSYFLKTATPPRA